MLLIVPNHLRDEIYRRIDAEIEKSGDPLAVTGRDMFYEGLLAYFNDHGVIPDFSIRRNEAEHPAPATASVATPSIDAADIEGQSK